MEKSDSLRKNPSRETCEKIIRKILTTEVMQQGDNTHFKQASDFMSYFESLYPASESLTKQVQRAIKSMDMPRDEKGCFIINKTSMQVKQDDLLKDILSRGDSHVVSMESFTPVFLSAEAPVRSYIKHLLNESITFRDKILTISETCNGLILYTDNPEILCKLLSSCLIC